MTSAGRRATMVRMPPDLVGAAWGEPDAIPSLDADAVHVWRIALDLDEDAIERLSPHLSPPERERAGRFVFDVHRKRYIVAHAALREILSLGTGMEPRDLVFREGPRGKPSLDLSCSRPSPSPAGYSAVEFNLSHSDDLALLAVSRRVVGVDVERIRPSFTGDEIAERFFSNRETTALRALEPGQRVNGFFRCWTSKEAFIKARGDGLSYPLDQFDVVVNPSASAELLRTEQDAADAPRWSMHDLDPGAGYAGTICVAVPTGAPWSLSRFVWTAHRER
jgi:4'-phosphopantetheinyl transferase